MQVNIPYINGMGYINTSLFRFPVPSSRIDYLQYLQLPSKNLQRRTDPLNLWGPFLGTNGSNCLRRSWICQYNMYIWTKMNCENNGKPLFLNGWCGGKNFIFGNIHIYIIFLCNILILRIWYWFCIQILHWRYFADNCCIYFYTYVPGCCKYEVHMALIYTLYIAH